MENKKKAKVDYAAIIREFEMYGRGRSLKQFCDDSSYVYPNVLRSAWMMKKFFLPVFATKFAGATSLRLQRVSQGSAGQYEGVLYAADHQKASDNLIASLNEKITKLTSMLEKSSLSASEAQWLARMATKWFTSIQIYLFSC